MIKDRESGVQTSPIAKNTTQVTADEPKLGDRREDRNAPNADTSEEALISNKDSEKHDDVKQSEKKDTSLDNKSKSPALSAQLKPTVPVESKPTISAGRPASRASAAKRSST